MSSADFICNCEGDVERITAVFAEWLEAGSVDLNKQYTIRVPNELWANVFVDIYTDVLHNRDLAHKAEQNVIQITFQVENSLLDQSEWNELSKMSDEELLDAIEDLLDDMEDEDDPEEGDEEE